MEGVAEHDKKIDNAGMLEVSIGTQTAPIANDTANEIQVDEQFSLAFLKEVDAEENRADPGEVPDSQNDLHIE